MYPLGILCLVVATAALPVLPDPPKLSHSVAAHQDSKIHTFQIQNAATASALRDEKDNGKVEKDLHKIASVVFSPSRQSSPFHDSILKKHKAYKKQIYDNRVNQKAKNSKRKKESIVPEKSLEVEILPDPGRLTILKKGFHDCEVCANILIVSPGSAPVADKKDDDTVKNNIVMIPSIIIPTPPELSEYSILKKQTAEQIQKNVMKQEAEMSKRERETLILDQEKSALVELPPNPGTFLGSETAPQDSEVRNIKLSVTTDSTPEADKKDNEKVRHNMVKIASEMPPPPELPPLDYPTLRKQKTDHNLKSKYFAKQSAEKYIEDKETVIVDLEKQDQVEVPPNPPTLPDSVLALPGSEVISDGDNIEAKMNMIKVAPIVIPPPPELPQFDYSVLRKQLADQERKYNDALKQEAKKSKEDKVVVIPDLATLPDSVDALPVSEVISASKSSNEEAKVNMVKMAPIHIPPPPELPPFDYSILRKQKAEHNLKSDFSTKQSTQKYKEDKETVIVDLEKQDQVEVPPNPPTLPDSVLALPGSEVISDGDYVEAKMNMIKVAPIVIPPPPELPQFDYSVLRKQLSDQERKYNDALKQEAKKSKEDKVVVIPDLATLPDSVDALPVSEVISASKSSNEEAKVNMVKIASIHIPPPPELPPFDYSILRKQKAEHNLKSDFSTKQSTQKYKEDKETVIVDLEKQDQVEVPPNPPTLPDSVLALPGSEVISDGDNIEAKMNMIKVAPIVIPPPPELPQFDYSVLRKQLADQERKYNDALKQEAKKSKEDKVVVIPDLATLPDSVDALPVSEVISASKSSNEEAKVNMVKMAPIHIPPPPELPPFDYSILRKQKAEHNLKSDFSTKQSTQKYKEDKETVIVDLEKQDQVEVPPNPPTLPDSVLALPGSEVISDGDYVEAKMNMIKVAPIVIPPPPELPQFDYSVLRKQLSDQERKYNDALKQEAKKSKEDKVVVIPDLATLPDSVDALPVSEVISASKSSNEEAKVNMVKIASIHIPPPPELPPFDYSILRKQKAEHNLKSDFSTKQSTQKYKEDKETVIVDLEKQDQVEVPPNPPTLPDSVLALPGSEVISDGDNIEAKMNMIKVAPIVIPPPPELPQFDYSVLRKQLADQERKYNDALKQEAKKSKEDKVVVIPDLATLPDSVDALPVSEVISASKSSNEEAKVNMVKMAPIHIPPPPELPPFDYSILRKQKAEHNLKSDFSTKQSTQKYKEDKETVIVDLEKQDQVEVPPNPPTLPDSVLALPGSEVISDGDYVEAKMNMIKVAPIVIPPPPELPQFDYSVLRKQLSDQERKYNDALKQEAKKSKEDKVVVIPDLATLPDSVDALPVSEVISASKSSNEEAKVNMVKIASIHIPPPPELPPFDYSILRKQKADNNLKSDFSIRQLNEKYKEEKETVIEDLEKQVKIKVPPKPPTLPDSVLAHPVSEMINDGDSVEAKINTVKVAPIVIPPPPELPQFDYSVLKKQVAGQKQKFNDVLIKQEAEKSKKEKGFAIGKPVEIEVYEPKLVEESKFVGVSKPMEEFKPVEEFKPSEVVIKEPVQHSEDIPVIIQLTIPSSPFLSKLTSNCPPLPGFDLNWPYQRSAMSRCPHLIYPKFDINGKIYTN